MFRGKNITQKSLLNHHLVKKEESSSISVFLMLTMIQFSNVPWSKHPMYQCSLQLSCVSSTFWSSNIRITRFYVNLNCFPNGLCIIPFLLFSPVQEIDKSVTFRVVSLEGCQVAIVTNRMDPEFPYKTFICHWHLGKGSVRDLSFYLLLLMVQQSKNHRYLPVCWYCWVGYKSDSKKKINNYHTIISKNTE